MHTESQTYIHIYIHHVKNCSENNETLNVSIIQWLLSTDRLIDQDKVVFSCLLVVLLCQITSRVYNKPLYGTRFNLQGHKSLPIVGLSLFISSLQP